MLTVYDSQGQSYQLTEQIGRGGEGTVFACPDDYNLVAKIYHEPVEPEKAEKLSWMAANQNDRLLKVAAWIVDVLTDSEGRVVGFLMPNVKAKEIHELYSLKSRRVYFPEATWTFLVHTAANVARAFYVLHKNEHIMGDVNHGNCVVLADGTVKLIDCDSYSIKRGDRRDACDVGVATHLAPELQGRDLSAIERIPAHDNFGLAVIIFQLLFLGRHPFAGRYLGDEEKSLEDCIRELRFAYSSDAHLWQVKQPPGTLSLSKVSPRVAAMFERAFLTEDRPVPREWIEALEDLSSSLAQCNLHIGHYYYNGLDACPWCEIETQTGLMLFPFVSHNASNREENFNIFTVENLLASLAVPSNLPAKPQKTALMVMPSEEAQIARRRNRRQWITFSAGQFLFMLFVMAIFGSGAAFFLGVILMIAFLVISGDAGKNLKGELEEKVGQAKADWAQLENQWTTLDTAGFSDDYTRAQQKIADYRILQKRSLHEMKLLRERDFRYRLDLYLAGYRLNEANLSDLRENRLKMLESFGFLTAADIEPKRLNAFPAIDEATRQSVLEWRQTVEKSFDPQEQADAPEADLKRFETDFSVQRRAIEKEIENLLGILRARSTFLRQRRQHLKETSEKLAQKLLQTEADAAAVGSLAPLATTLILLTTLMPIFGVALQTPKVNYATRNGYGDSPLVVAKPVTSRPGETNSALIVKPDLPTALTDKQIEAMNYYERQDLAEALYSEVVNHVDGKDDHAGAERKMRLAVRLAPEEISYHTRLGIALYDQQKYAESVKSLKKAMEIDSENEQTKIYLGKNYLKTKQFSAAVIVLSEVTDKNAQSFEGNFNLGLAYKGLKNYQTALNHFSKAVFTKSNNADALYEYGYCFYKTGNVERATDQYERLLGIDPEKAEKLRREIGIAGNSKLYVAEEPPPVEAQKKKAVRIPAIPAIR